MTPWWYWSPDEPGRVRLTLLRIAAALTLVGWAALGLVAVVSVVALVVHAL